MGRTSNESLAQSFAHHAGHGRARLRDCPDDLATEHARRRPTGLQLPLLIILSALDALSLGLGVAFISYGLPLLRRITGASRIRTWACFIATTWLLSSWCLAT
jgi:hypothetical protein